MDFLHAAIALLASLVLVLAGLVGWLYWQQTRIFQNMSSIVMMVSDVQQQIDVVTRNPEARIGEMEAIPEPLPESTDEHPETEDDRLSVDQSPADIVNGPPVDTDDLDGKTKKELQDVLIKKGIPFGKQDTKTTLISLIKATA